MNRRSLTTWDYIETRSQALALLEVLAWKLEGNRERTEGFDMLKRTRDRLADQIVGLVSCEFDTLRTAARYIAEENARKDLGVTR